MPITTQYLEPDHGEYYRDVRMRIATLMRLHPDMGRSEARRRVLDAIRVWSEYNYKHLLWQRGMASVKDANDYLTPFMLFQIPDPCYNVPYVGRRNPKRRWRPAGHYRGPAHPGDFGFPRRPGLYFQAFSQNVQEIYGRSPQDLLAAMRANMRHHAT